MKLAANQPILGKMDHNILMNYLKSNDARTLFNRYDAEELLAELKKAKVVADDKVPEDVIRLNSTVKVLDGHENRTIELTLVTPKQADIKKKRISVMSPVGIALLGYKKGEHVIWKVPSGEKRFFIVDVRNEYVDNPTEFVS